MDSCIAYDEMFCGQYKPYKKTEDLISFNQLSGVLIVYTKYPELSESFLIKSRTGIAIILQSKIWKRMEKLQTFCLFRPSE